MKRLRVVEFTVVSGAKHGLKSGVGNILAIIAAVALAGCASGAAFASSESAAPSKPAGQKANVLLIAIDDLRPDLGAYGHPTAVTPSLNEFAATGMLFERAYTQQAVCGPSRAALMSGLRPDTTGITTLEQPLHKTVPDAVSIAGMFKANGYETMSIGKIYHHKDDDPEGWTVPPFNTVYGWRNQQRKSGLPNLAYKSVTGAEADDLPDTRNLARAVREMRRLKKEGKPFFMAFGVHKPHLPFYAPDVAWNIYDAKDVPEPVSRKPQEGAPDYAVVAYEIWNYDNTPKKGPMPEDTADELRRGYLAAVTYSDSIVGALLEELGRLDLEDDTIVVIWSDHGFKLGDYDAWAKHSNVELDIHIPMMIRVPGRTKAGSRTAALVESVDLYPTLAELAGIEAPQNLEGLSLTPLFDNPKRAWKEAAFAQYDRGGKNNQTLGRTVRSERYRYTAWIDGATGKLVAQELYDHRVDPAELRNVAGDKAYAEALAHHEALRKSGWRSVRDAVKVKP